MPVQCRPHDPQAVAGALQPHRGPQLLRRRHQPLSALSLGSGVRPNSVETFLDLDDGLRLLGESNIQSSFSALMDNCGDPSDIALHVEASHIHDGNSRDMPDGASTWTTVPTPRPARRYSSRRCPYNGCHRYSITTDCDRYAECRLIPYPPAYSLLYLTLEPPRMCLGLYAGG
jgi:hypothetical protein